MALDLRHPARVSVVVTGTPGALSLVANALADEEASVEARSWDENGRTAVEWERPDLVVLDARRSGEGRDTADTTDAADTTDNTEEQTRYLRRRWPTLHVVVIGAADGERVLALMGAGADDATSRVTDAFRARLRAAVRRASVSNASSRIAVGDIVFEREAQRVWCAGQEVDMSRRELSVLDCLFWKAPSIVSADSLADFVWGDASVKARRGVVEVYISYLRRKLAASKQVVIGTVRGEGYRFEPRD